MMRNHLLLLFFSTAVLASCESRMQKQQFYDKALQLAKESVDEHSQWFVSRTLAEPKEVADAERIKSEGETDRKTRFNRLTAELDELKKERTRIEAEYNSARNVIVVSTEGYKDPSGRKTVVSGSAEYKAIAARETELESRRSDLDKEIEETRMALEYLPIEAMGDTERLEFVRNRAKPSKATTLTVAKVKEVLGAPSSILKDDFNEQEWRYQFSDGVVRIKLICVDGQDLDEDQTLVAMLPDQVEMIGK